MLRDEIEKEVAKLSNRKYAALVCSGTAGLILAMIGSGLKRGDEVLIPASCCPSVLSAVQLPGLSPILGDNNLQTLNMDLEQCQSAVSEQTKGLIAVHAYGRHCQIDLIKEFSKRKNIILIEDACLAFGSLYQQQSLGQFGQASVISFGYDKPISIGYGGAIMTDDFTIYHHILSFLDSNPFFNFNCSESKMKLLLERLLLLKSYQLKRSENIKFLYDNIQADKFIKIEKTECANFWRFPLIYSGNRDKLLNKINSKEVLLTTHYQSLGRFMTNAHTPNADYIADHIVNIFVNPEVSHSYLKKVANKINEFYE